MTAATPFAPAQQPRNPVYRTFRPSKIPNGGPCGPWQISRHEHREIGMDAQGQEGKHGRNYGALGSSIPTTYVRLNNPTKDEVTRGSRPGS